MEQHNWGTLRRYFILLLFMGMFDAGEAQTRFVTAFMENFYVSEDTTFQLYLVTYDKPATVTITVSQPQFNQTVHIGRDNYAMVTLNYTYMIAEKYMTSKAVLVQSDTALSVFAFYTAVGTADAMACLPVEDLGTEYYISTAAMGAGKQFAVANGVEETALVNVTVVGSISYNGVEYTKGQSFSVSLQYQQSIQFQSSSDLTGTRISSTVPVAVFSGHKCFTGINTNCDTLVEQLYPVHKWGNFFVVVPIMNHTQDSITIVTSTPNTQVFVNNAIEPNEYFVVDGGTSLRVNLKEMSTINASKPIMVTYIVEEPKPGIVTGYGPFFVTSPPSLVARSYYKFVTQKTYFNFLLIVTQATSADGFYLDHRPLSLYNYSVQNFYDYRAFDVLLDKSEGQHEIHHEFMPFTIYVYGAESSASYGYSMGQETIYPDAPLPNPTEGYKPEGILQCLSNGAEYQLPMNMVLEAHLDVSDIHLEDPLCQAVTDEDFAFIQIPFSGCGSSVLIEDGKTYYENTIYGTIPGTSIHRIEIPVKCEMEMNETLGISIHPKVTDVVSLGHYNVSLKLYQSEDFSDLITAYPYEVDIHGRLYVEFKVESSDQNLQVLVENCKASPSLEDNEQIYSLIQQGCLQDTTLQTHKVSDQRLERFSLHVFKFNSFEEVYLSCNVLVCHNGTSPNRCTQGCFRRQRRDTRGSSVHMAAAKLSQGPIVFKSGELQTSHNVPSFVLVAVIGMMALMTVLALTIQKRYIKSHHYTLLQCTED
ncbi:uncharacterized protein [Pyxicephalus adspersus]|uniref:uncharacterized protein n=1 Tax=Pyxicephalus adspersus TaxID=30357 RepID=UPI003B5C4511